MSKKRILIALLLCAVIASTFALTACGGSYVLNFETNGGTAVESVKFRGGSKVTAPSTSKDYFTFDGWYTDVSLQNEFRSFDKMPSVNLTLYAKWLPASFGKINFVSNGGSAVESITGASGEYVQNTPSNPVKSGYVFSGWYANEQLTELYVFGTYPVGEVTLYAKWGRDNVNYRYAEFDVNGVVTEIAVSVNESLQNVTLPTFGDDVDCVWYADKEYTQVYAFPSNMQQDIKVYGLLTSKGLTVADGVVVSYDGAAEQVIVPSVYDGQTVIKIGNSAFTGNSSVKSVTLPETVTEIGDYAFYKCDYLSSVSSVSSVEAIGKFAFSDCQRLQSAINLDKLLKIEEGSFANCPLLTDVTFGEGLTEIGDYAFANCVSLQKAELPDTVENIFSYAFSNSGITSFVIPEQLATLGVGALKSCVNLTSISGGNDDFTVNGEDGTLFHGTTMVLYFETDVNKTDTEYVLPNGITRVDPYAFMGNANIRVLDLSKAANGNVVISNAALQGMESLETLIVSDFDANNRYLAYWFGAADQQQNTSVGLYVPVTLKEVTFTRYSANDVPAYAFYGCRGLESVNGLENASSIGAYAYAYTAFKTIELGAKVSAVGAAAFRGTSNLEEIKVSSDNETYKSIDGSLYNKAGTELHYAPANATVEFANGITVIKSGALYQNITIELVVPDSVQTIERGAFEGMNFLKKLTVPFIGGSRTANRYMLWVFGATVTPDSDGAINIGGDKCPVSLSEITLTTPVADIPNYAFTYCRGLSNLVNDVDITSVGDFAFYRAAFDEVIIPDTTKTIGRYAYYDCDQLTRVEIGSGMTSIGQNAFGNAAILEEIIFKEGTSDLTIADGAFLAQTTNSSGNVTATSALTKLQLSSNIVSIGKVAFGYQGSDAEDFEGFEVSFDVEKSRLKSIGDSAFGVSKVSKVTLPASIESVGSIAFGACELLTEVTIGSPEHEASKLTLFDDGAFAECPSLEKFVLYKTVTDKNDVPALGTGKSTYAPGLGVFATNSTQIYVPEESVEIYKEKWSSIADYIVAIKED
ncbi:MAG: leucine-rich repeat protein [Corallococcus sp.]|nr:leucine-rich repeat protein [Corallococcus sp.]